MHIIAASSYTEHSRYQCSMSALRGGFASFYGAPAATLRLKAAVGCPLGIWNEIHVPLLLSAFPC